MSTWRSVTEPLARRDEDRGQPAPGVAPFGIRVVNEAVPFLFVEISPETMASSPGTLSVNRAVAPPSFLPSGP